MTLLEDEPHAAIDEKIDDLETPGYEVEFDPDEAEQIGAFSEDALNEEDAADSTTDLFNGFME